MPYFTIEKCYLFIPFELKVKQKELLNLFLLMLENSGVGNLIQKYGYTRTRRRGTEKVSTEIMLTALGLNIAKLIRYYQTGKLNKFWAAPDNLKSEEFKKPSWKRLAKKGIKINKAQYENK